MDERVTTSQDLAETIPVAVKDLVKVYGTVTAVNRITFSLKPRSTVALLGGNGAGKTTTIAMLLGLVVPTSGEVKVFGADMSRNRYQAAQRLNFQSPYVDLPMRLTVRQNLTVYAGLYGVANAEERISFLAKDLQLTALLDRATGKLSAGQKTRVGLAKALLNAPELLLLDEPTASLDPAGTQRIEELCHELKRLYTIVIVTHNLQQAARVSDYTAFFYMGRLIEVGRTSALFTKPQVEQTEQYITGRFG
jgi:ABC-2 type transport system ATP-binding protein